MKKFLVSLLVIAGLLSAFGGVVGAENKIKAPDAPQNFDGAGW